jgi:hypothetical protein
VPGKKGKLEMAEKIKKQERRNKIIWSACENLSRKKVTYDDKKSRIWGNSILKVYTLFTLGFWYISELSLSTVVPPLTLVAFLANCQTQIRNKQFFALLLASSLN